MRARSSSEGQEGLCVPPDPCLARGSSTQHPLRFPLETAPGGPRGSALSPCGCSVEVSCLLSGASPAQRPASSVPALSRGGALRGLPRGHSQRLVQGLEEPCVFCWVSRVRPLCGQELLVVGCSSRAGSDAAHWCSFMLQPAAALRGSSAATSPAGTGGCSAPGTAATASQLLASGIRWGESRGVALTGRSVSEWGGKSGASCPSWSGERVLETSTASPACCQGQLSFGVPVTMLVVGLGRAGQQRPMHWVASRERRFLAPCCGPGWAPGGLGNALCLTHLWHVHQACPAAWGCADASVSLCCVLAPQALLCKAELGVGMDMQLGQHGEDLQGCPWARP